MRHKWKYLLPTLTVAAALLGAVIWRHESAELSAPAQSPVKAAIEMEQNRSERSAGPASDCRGETGAQRCPASQEDLAVSPVKPEEEMALPSGAEAAADTHDSAPPLARREAAPVLHEAARNPEAWMAHAAAPQNGPLPMIAIVIDDVGVNAGQTPGVLRLPAAVTLSVLPYARDAAGVAARARALGHELLVHLPMEADGGQDPGPRALRHSQSPDEFSENLEWNLSRFTGFVGVNNHMGSRLTQDAAAMERLHGNLHRRGVLFLDSRTTPETVAARIARASGVTTLERDVFLDNSTAPENIQAQLRMTEAKARRRGYAIAIGHPYPATIEAVGNWAKNLKARGFALVPLTSVTRSMPGPQTAARH